MFRPDRLPSHVLVHIQILLGVALVFFMAAAPASAGTLTSMQVDPTQSRVGNTLSVTVRASGDRCGIQVRYGDGRLANTALTGQTTLSVQYPVEGNYTITVVGRPHNNRRACEGTGTVPGVDVTILPAFRLERQQLQRPTIRPGSPKPKGPKGDRATSPSGQAPQPDLPDVQIPDIRIERTQVTRYATVVDLKLDFNLPSASVVEFEGRSGAEIVRKQWSNVSSGQTLVIDGLKPFYTYETTVHVKHRGKHIYERSNFRTKRRKVTVLFAEVHAIDDGDLTNAGDFTFYVKDPNDDTRYALKWEHGISTGTMVASNKSFEESNVRNPDFRVRGIIAEDDPDSSSIFATEPGGSSVGFNWPFDLDSVDPRSGGTLTFNKKVAATHQNFWELRLKGEVRIEFQ